MPEREQTTEAMEDSSVGGEDLEPIRTERRQEPKCRSSHRASVVSHLVPFQPRKIPNSPAPPAARGCSLSAIREFHALADDDR